MLIRFSNELFNEKIISNTFSYRQKTEDLAQDLQHHLEKNKSTTTPLCPGDQLLLESEKKERRKSKAPSSFLQKENKEEIGSGIKLLLGPYFRLVGCQPHCSLLDTLT